ncbi:hypothetical protein PsorP6_011357 [Peronosclerospora sorghi]|uniref:Uncharacterized protein n=1 Tax=Peronosclerospora sorghi TaxID=230839 RepID=A0ACC0WLJ1_9STRA|nr:hypothetical protein PsorP6_011357 [Peronosclerospora sorghi]
MKNLLDNDEARELHTMYLNHLIVLKRGDPRKYGEYEGASRLPHSIELNDGDKDDGDEIVAEGDEEAPAIGQDTFDTLDELQACAAQYRARADSHCYAQAPCSKTPTTERALAWMQSTGAESHRFDKLDRQGVLIW